MAAEKKYLVTIERTVIETVTVNITAPSQADARFRAGAVTANSRDEEWERDVGPTRVGKVERAEAQAADPMAVPHVLVRSASGP